MPYSAAACPAPLAQIAMESDLVLGGAVQIVNTSLAERLLAERSTTSAEITAHQDDWEELAQLSIGVVTSGARQVLVDIVTTPNPTIAPVLAGDTLMRVIADARYDATATRAGGQVTLELSQGGQPVQAAVFDGASHAELSFTMNAQNYRLALLWCCRLI